MGIMYHNRPTKNNLNSPLRLWKDSASPEANGIRTKACIFSQETEFGEWLLDVCLNWQCFFSPELS